MSEARGCWSVSLSNRETKKKREKEKKISTPPRSCVNHILTKRLLASPSHRLADYFSQPPKTRFTPPHTTTRRYGVGGDLDAVRSNLLLVFSAFYFDSDSTDVCETQNQKINMKNRLVSSAGGRERLVDFLSSFSMVRRGTVTTMTLTMTPSAEMEICASFKLLPRRCSTSERGEVVTVALFSLRNFLREPRGVSQSLPRFSLKTCLADASHVVAQSTSKRVRRGIFFAFFRAEGKFLSFPPFTLVKNRKRKGKIFA